MLFRKIISIVSLVVAMCFIMTSAQAADPSEQTIATKKKQIQHAARGNSYLSLGLLDKAIDEYKQALSIDPDDAIIHNNIGIAYAGEGRFDKAMPAFRQALKIDPNYIGAHFNLGIVYAQKQMYKQAKKQFQIVLSLDSGFKPASKALRNLKKAGY